ncbi:MAG: imidazole glycerol phosphate synthase subunit HisH [Candidatus Sericytochromatia bacterium]|nr:imidazole glycerol phosphate synthase subunit HisH [Candidatus Sericytochromatia bacterium]
MTTTVTVVDYGVGNMNSVINALGHLGATVTVSDQPEVIASAERLVLPGVGAFPDGMRLLRERGLDEALHMAVGQGRPLLGICLGMQLLFDGSDEFGDHPGLGLVPGRVIRLAPAAGFKVPQIGWNRLVPGDRSWAGTILAATAPETMVYFVHSYAPDARTAVGLLATCDYGGHPVTAVIQHGPVSGCQFHPEKSGPAGLGILSAFLQQ